MIEIPKDLEEWSMKTLNELLKFVDIESETLDFKKEPNKLHEHLCAMANVNGGFLVLGINEIKSEDGKKIIRFEKIGFNEGEQDMIRNSIGNSMFNVDPIPNVSIKNLLENGKFYSVIKIESETSKKPYFIKDKGQCFIRVGNSTRPASRSVILNLFGASVEQQKQVVNLQIASEITKEAFKHALGDIHSASWDSVGKIPPLDLTFLRNSTSTCAWLLRENNLLGKHTSQTGYEIGIHSILHDLEFLNVHIYAYNLAKTDEERQPIASFLQPWGLGSSYEEKTIGFLEKIITITEEFLKKYQ